MQTLLLWVFALYGVSTLLIHVAKRFYHSRRKTGIHYCVYTCNSQNNIEWMIRYLSRLACLEGRAFRFTVYDYGSIDDTLAIIECLKRDGLFIEVKLPGHQDGIIQWKKTDEAYIVVDLRETSKRHSLVPQA